MSKRQGHRCIMTGIAFEPKATKPRNPYAMSVDRIDSSRGYTMDNIRLVCACVNFALHSYGDEVFYRMCEAALVHRNRNLKER
jgi:hypothetical protein